MSFIGAETSHFDIGSKTYDNIVGLTFLVDDKV